MKIFYILSLWSVSVFSQTILYQPETSSRTVQDPQAIILAPGFYAKADTSNPFIAKIGPATQNSGGGPADSDSGSGNPSGTTAPSGQSFHDTKGNIEVNGSGQLQFTLPIALPPGVKSVAPQISLVYSSGSGNGIAGYGWNLSGITSISRTGKNIEKDGEVKAVQLDYSDYYMFNGQRLILKSGEYGKDGAEYVTEKYSNVKIKSVGTGPISGPAQFEVTFEDGSQAWYGAYKSGFRDNPDITTPLEYNIIKWKDVQGNVIHYNYRKQNNVVILTSITWGGNEVLNKKDFNEITLTYSNRSLSEQSYVHGISFTQNNLLKEIKVSSNGSQFKRYEVDYVNNNTNYKFVNKVTEYNAANEPANPVSFTYESDATANSMLRSDSRYDEIFKGSMISGDYDGDGKLDFISGDKLMLKRIDGTGEIYSFDRDLIGWNPDNIFVGTHSKVSNANAIDNVRISYDPITGVENAIKVNICKYDKNLKTTLLQESKKYDLTGYYNNSDPQVRAYLKVKAGDFNGDGVTDFIAYVTWATSEDVGVEVPNYIYTYYAYKQFYINPLSDKLEPIDIGEVVPDNIIAVNDFLGDGTQQILILRNGRYKVFRLDTVSKKLVYLYDLPDSIDSSLPLHYGDFNGDKKIDILVPKAKDSSDWAMYLSTGNSFVKYDYANLFLYQPSFQGSPRKNRNIQRSYFVPDLNKDGKSDFVIFESQVWYRDGVFDWNDPDSSYGFSYLRNDGVDASGKPIFTNAYSISPKELNWDGEDINYSMYGEHYIPLFGSFRIAQFNTEFAIIHKTKLITWDMGNKLNLVSRIKSINQSGIKTDIEYASLTHNGNIYQSDYNTIDYPYVNIAENVNYSVVSRLLQEGRKQEFRYRDLIVNLYGKGMIGFRQTARSTFFTDEFAGTKVWNGSQIDPVHDGLPYKDWTIRTTDESQIFPADISLQNTQLLSFKQYEYTIDRLLNGSVVTNVSAADQPKIVTAINPYRTTSKDFLKNIKTVHTVEEYDNLYLPTRSVTNINDGFSVVRSELEYYPSNTSPGTNYSIGKPKIKTDITQAYGDTKSAKEEYVYDNNLLKTLKTWNQDNTGYLQEAYSYDGFGNIIRKTVSNSIDSQVQNTRSEYDAKGRFVIRKTDNLGLETQIGYNDLGQVVTQTDPLGNILTNTYDHWGKLLTSKTNLAGTTTYQYERDTNSNIIITQNDPDGNISKKYTNKLGQEYKTSVKAFGQWFINVESQYDVLGRKLRESEPFSGQPWQWNTITYDDNYFPAKVTATTFNGKQTETSVSGLTTSLRELNGYGRTTSKTEDALGNTASSTDKGGSITFSYNAAGEQTKAQYAGNTVTTAYDAWGRKSEFNDPSNGIYKYEYDGFGQPKKIISPKGTKEYTYNNLGQLISQKELSTADGGKATNKLISFTYDDKGRLISKSGTSKGESFSSSAAYDPQGRLLSSSESSNGKYFIQKGITYDNTSRVTSYEKQLYSSGVLTKVQIENVYSAWNGDLYQIKDKTSGKILWELKEANAKGQVLKAQLGAAEIRQTYENDGTLSQVAHYSAVKPNILQLAYDFDPIKNELQARTTGGDFNITESFDYDDNNRLVNWTNPVTGVKPSANRNVYDVKGRILENDQVGKIKFENAAKIYQPTGMTLNTAGTQNYTNDLIQSISYNENNDPVFIDGEKGDVAFRYGLTAMRQRVTYGGNFSADGEGKFTKFYSEDGSYEIVKDNTTGKEKHIIYIGGSPYESNIVYLKNYTESSGSYKFLHKDYLGSILAISDEAGNKLEQRHFDAWGNLTHLQIGNGAIITDRQQLATSCLLIDRGYTSHEHFGEIGIIHMNGRLYDPLLRRFLNADEFIQDPYNTQNYNKYGYVMNNPLLYNDPTGEIMGWDDALIAIGIAIFTSVATDYYLNQPISFGNMFQSVVMSLASAGISSAIGDVFLAGTKVAESLGKTGTIIAKAGAHAIAQGTLSYVQGGNFLSGALSGAFASVSNDLLGLALNNVGDNSILKSDAFALFNGAVSGGVGSVLGGGNFWAGAGQGLIVTAFNYLAHQVNAIDGDDPKQKTPGNKYGTLEEYRAWRDYSGYHKGETKMDRIFRLMNSSHIEIMGDEGAGGGMMYGSGGGRGAVAKDITSRLQRHVTEAAAEVDRLGDGAFTPKQVRAIQRNPNLRAAFRGNRIDVKARDAIEKDPALQHLKSNYSKGPDFVDPKTGKWWDMTTPAQWQKHVNKYGAGGTLLRTR